MRLSVEDEATDLWQMGQSENYKDSPYHGPKCPRLEYVSNSAHGDWELEHGDWRANPGQELLLAVGRWPEGTGGRKWQQRMPMEENQNAMEAGRYC